MYRLQDISRLLLAAGGTPSRDGKTTHFTYEKDGSLRIRTWTGSELIDDELIADGVRPGTSAPIVNRSHKKVFAVYHDDSIKCFTNPLRDDEQVDEDEIDDDAPWNEEKITDVDTRVHTRSQLAISYDKNTVFIFHQKPDGTLGCINEYENKWRAIKLPAVAALDGTPLATCNTNYAVFLFYISTDGTVRYLENREGKWNDVFFSAAKIVDPKAKLPGSAFRLTVAEDRQPFERIRPMVFCLDQNPGINTLSIVRFRSRKLETIGRVEDTEFVPSFGETERNRYYFWSPYPFYTMIKRRGKYQGQATISKWLWNRRPSAQQECGNSSAIESLNRLQGPSIDRSTPTVNNRAQATVSLETTTAQAIISPQRTEQIETSKGTFLERSVFLHRIGLTEPWKAIRRTFLGTGRNGDAAAEGTSRNGESSRTDTAHVPFETEESQIVGMEGDAVEANETKTSTSETEEIEVEEAEVEQLHIDESNSHETEAEEALIREDRSENRPEEADSDDTEEETASVGTHSEAADTAPSEVEAEIEKNQSPKLQAEESHDEDVVAKEFEGEEIEGEEIEGEESEGEESEGEEVEDEEVQCEEIQQDEIQHDEIQHDEVQHDEVQHDEVQHDEVHHDEVQHDEVQHDEVQYDEVQEEELQTEKPQIKEAQTKAVQTEEVQTKKQNEEAQRGESQPGKGQIRTVQAEEFQTEKLQTDNAQRNNAKPEGYEIKVPNTGGAEADKQEPKNVTWREPKSDSASDNSSVPTTKPITTEPTKGLPAMKPSVTQGNGQEADEVESDLQHPDSKISKQTGSPITNKGKGLATTNTPNLNQPTYNTPQDIQEDMTDFIKNADLDLFFPKDSTFVPTVADKAFELKNNEENLLNRDVDIQGLTRLSLYQPVLYCDDSTSMKASSRVSGQKERTRVNDQKDMVRRVARITTSVVPPGHGTSLQFINFVRDIHDSKLNLVQVEAIMNSVKPKGHTEIGINLKKKILKPLIYDVIKNNQRLERPILVSCITDGCPSDADPKRFKKEILKCKEFLEEHGYPPSTIRFQISQIGNSSRADEFLKELKNDKELKEVLYCTAQRLDDQFETFRHNELMLERWLLQTLLEPLMGQGISSLNLRQD